MESTITSSEETQQTEHAMDVEDILSGVQECWIETSKPKMTKTNREATAAVEVAFSVSGNAGKFVQELFDRHKGSTIKQIESCIAEFRTAMYALTSPWTPNRRIASSEVIWGKLTEMYEDAKSEFDNLVSQLVREYSDLVAARKAELGGLFSESDYPDKSDLQDSFVFRFDFQAIASPNHAVMKAAGNKVDAVREIMRLRYRKGLNRAMANIYGKLHAVVSKAAETLADEHAGFHGTLITNISDVLEAVDGLNLTEDEDLKQIAADLKRKLAKVDPKSLRKTGKSKDDIQWKIERKAAAEEAKKAAEKIADKMSAFTGD